MSQEKEQQEFVSMQARMLEKYLVYIGKSSSLPPEDLEVEKIRVTQWLSNAEDVYRELAPNAYELAFNRIRRISHVFIGLVNQEDPDGEVLKYLTDLPAFARLVGGIPEWLKK